MVDGANRASEIFIRSGYGSAVRAGYPIAQNGVVIMIGPYQFADEGCLRWYDSIFAFCYRIFYITLSDGNPKFAR